MRIAPKLPSAALALIVSAVVWGQQPGSGNASVLEKHYEAAQTLQRQGQEEEAARQYRLFLADALGELAIVRAHALEYAQAAPLFDEALGLAPNSPALQIEYAQAALNAGDSSRAQTLAREVEAAYTGNRNAVAKAHLILGRALFAESRSQEARQEFAAAVDLNLTMEDGYALALACLELHDRPCAAKMFSQLEAAFGDSAAIHMDFGRAYGESNYQPDAVAEFQKAIEEDPRFPDAHYSLAAALMAAEGDAHLDEAEAELKKELEGAPGDALAWAALGRIATRKHRYAEAEKDLKQAIALDPTNPDAFLYLGQMDVALGRNQEAEEALRECVRLTTDEKRNGYQVQQAYFLLGRLLHASGHDAEAQTQMAKAQQLAKAALARDQLRMQGMLEPTSGAAGEALVSAPGEAPAANPAAVRQADEFEKKIAAPVADSYNNLGVLAAGEHDFAYAVTCFERAAEWNAALPGLDKNWGRALFYAGRYREAVPALTRWIRQDPADTESRAALGISEFMSGNYGACVGVLQPMQQQLGTIPAAQRAYTESLERAGRH